MASSYKSKIAAELLHAIEADVNVAADIMVQLESPQEIIARACENDSNGLDRTQKTACMVDSMEKFAEEAQQNVRELLDRHSDWFTKSSFFWINNSVSVKQAKGALVLKLAQLETVLEVRPEAIFHTAISGGNRGEDEEVGKPKMMMGTFGV